MRRQPVLDESSMQSAEAQIPELARRAGQAAHQRALSNPTATLVMKNTGGQLVARQVGGAVVVLKSLPAGTPVRAGTVLKRALKKSAPSKADGQ